MESSFDLILWRRLLIDSTPVPTGGDFLDWSQRLADIGELEASALLTNVAAIHQGFSSQAIVSRKRFPSSAELSADFSSNQGSTLHHAISELRKLAKAAAAHDLPRLAEFSPFVASGHPDNIAAVVNGVPIHQPIEDVAVTARELRHRLESPFADGVGLQALLENLVETGRRYGPFDLDICASIPLSLLVPQVAVAGLIDFALSTQDLWKSPTGSPAFLHHVARLDSGALGPYFSNVGQLARNSHDVINFAHAAHQSSPDQDDPDNRIVAWVVLLSRCCRRELLFEIVDDLGDHHAQGALLAILNRVASRPEPVIDREIVMRLRDAGLDNANYVLAAHAQQVLVRLSPDSITEGRILGEIKASGGAFGHAEAIFRYWLTRMPDDDSLHERLKAARMHDFDRFAITSGFDSPADRREIRTRRRGLPPQYTRRVGERVRAVDLG